MLSTNNQVPVQDEQLPTAEVSNQALIRTPIKKQDHSWLKLVKVDETKNSLYFELNAPEEYFNRKHLNRASSLSHYMASLNRKFKEKLGKETELHARLPYLTENEKAEIRQTHPNVNLARIIKITFPDGGPIKIADTKYYNEDTEERTTTLGFKLEVSLRVLLSGQIKDVSKVINYMENYINNGAQPDHPSRKPASTNENETTVMESPPLSTMYITKSHQWLQLVCADTTGTVLFFKANLPGAYLQAKGATAINNYVSELNKCFKKLRASNQFVVATSRLEPREVVLLSATEASLIGDESAYKKIIKITMSGPLEVNGRKLYNESQSTSINCEVSLRIFLEIHKKNSTKVLAKLDFKDLIATMEASVLGLSQSGSTSLPAVTAAVTEGTSTTTTTSTTTSSTAIVLTSEPNSDVNATNDNQPAGVKLNLQKNHTWLRLVDSCEDVENGVYTLYFQLEAPEEYRNNKLKSKNHTKPESAFVHELNTLFLRNLPQAEIRTVASAEVSEYDLAAIEETNPNIKRDRIIKIQFPGPINLAGQKLYKEDDSSIITKIEVSLLTFLNLNKNKHTLQNREKITAEIDRMVGFVQNRENQVAQSSHSLESPTTTTTSHPNTTTNQGQQAPEFNSTTLRVQQILQPGSPPILSTPKRLRVGGSQESGTANNPPPSLTLPSLPSMKSFLEKTGISANSTNQPSAPNNSSDNPLSSWYKGPKEWGPR